MPNTIREAVAESLSNLSERTRNQVVEHFAVAEANKQANALITGLDKLRGMENDLRKIKPQVTAFNEGGDPVGEPTYTKQQVDDRKKLNEQITKLTNAITKADDKADFGDLYNLAKGGGSPKPDAE